MRYHGQLAEFSELGWCPADAELWLWKHFHNDDRFIPVVWDPSNPDESPVFPKTVESDSE